MFRQTHRGHLKFGYAENESIFRKTDISERWFVRHGAVSRTPMTFREEAVTAAKLIHADLAAGRKSRLQLFYSGGADSEFMMRAFLEARVPFETLIIRFDDGLNSHDIAYAERFCQSVGLTPKYLDLDIHDFFYSGEAEKYSIASQIHSPALLHHLWAIDRTDGVPIFANGENYWVKAERYNPSSLWHFWDEEMFFGFHRMLIVRDRPGVPAFFKYTPELILSGVLEPSIQALIGNRLNPKWFDSETIKHEIYRRNFPMQELPVPGYTGFEKLFMLFAEYVYRFKVEQLHDIQKLTQGQLLDQLNPSCSKSSAGLVL